VTRDTVVKWIRRGRLTAARTAGGHYRIALEELQRAVPAAVATPDPVRGRPEYLDSPMHCWDFLNGPGERRDECRRCVAYRVGATWCFLLRQEQGDGEASFCCGPESCQTCPYYRQAMGLPTRVLVITADEDLTQALQSDDEPDLECDFARTGYEAAARLPECYPAIVVVDSEVDQGRGAALLAQLSEDPRVRGLKIIFWMRRRGATPAQGLEPGQRAVDVVTKPPGLEDLRSFRDQHLVEPLDVARREELARIISGGLNEGPARERPQSRKS